MVNIRTIQPSDLDRVVQVHMKSFQGFFLSFLGAAFLKELYSGILIDPTGIHYVGEIDDKIQGVVFSIWVGS